MKEQCAPDPGGEEGGTDSSRSDSCSTSYFHPHLGITATAIHPHPLKRICSSIQIRRRVHPISPCYLNLPPAPRPYYYPSIRCITLRNRRRSHDDIIHSDTPRPLRSADVLENGSERRSTRRWFRSRERCGVHLIRRPCCSSRFRCGPYRVRTRTRLVPSPSVRNSKWQIRIPTAAATSGRICAERCCGLEDLGRKERDGRWLMMMMMVVVVSEASTPGRGVEVAAAPFFNALDFELGEKPGTGGKRGRWL